MKAMWNNTLIAESKNTVVIEGNHYFPEDSLIKHFFYPSNHRSICHWKGEANYYDIVINGKTNENAAWYYPAPKEKALNIKNHIGFWQGVIVSE